MACGILVPPPETEPRALAVRARSPNHWTSGPRINHFSKDPWFFLLENGIRNQDLGARYTHCYWGVLSFGPPQLTKEIYVYPVIHTHI